VDNTDRALIAALAQVRYQPDSFHKRFAANMARRAQEPGATLSAKQRGVLENMRRHYRRQLRGINPILVADLGDAPTATEKRRQREAAERAKLETWEQAMKGDEDAD
jgi:hypothetical protein